MNPAFTRTLSDGTEVTFLVDDEDWPSAALCRRLADERKQAAFQEEMKHAYADRRRKGLPL